MIIRNQSSWLFLIIFLFCSVSLVLPKASAKDPEHQETKFLRVKESPEEMVVKEYFKYLFLKPDMAALGKLIAEEAVYYQAEGLPYGGTYVGFDQWVRMYQNAQGYFDLHVIGEPVLYSSSQNHGELVIYFVIRCVSKKTKREIIMPVSEHFKVKDSLITEIRPFYFDTKTFTDFIN